MIAAANILPFLFFQISIFQISIFFFLFVIHHVRLILKNKRIFLCDTLAIARRRGTLFDTLAIARRRQGFHSQNFCAIFAERNAKFFFLCASFLREKITICAIIRKSHFAQNCPIPLLRNSSFAQFRNFVPKSETDCPEKVSTILVLDMHIS